MINICGRKVKVVTGRKSQTINVCTEDNIHGEYEYIFRLNHRFTSEKELFEECFFSLNEMKGYLLNNFHATIERSPEMPKQEIPVLSFPSEDTSPDSVWDQQAVVMVEDSINQLVDEFIKHPFLHRVEHSLHCQLFNILSKQEMLSRTYNVGGWLFQPIHKEWPEWTPRPEHDNYRGNFDIAIVEPQEMLSLNDFKRGYVKPHIAIEIGLDYPLEHLLSDHNKLINSQIKHPYLIHFVREQFYKSEFSEIKEFLTESKIPTAFARTYIEGIDYKKVTSKDIQYLIYNKERN